MQLAVGRLGIVTEIDFKIVPQRLLTRTVTTQSFDDFVAWTLAAQDRFKTALASGSQTAISDSLRAVDQTQVGILLAINQISHSADVHAAGFSRYDCFLLDQARLRPWFIPCKYQIRQDWCEPLVSVMGPPKCYSMKI